MKENPYDHDDFFNAYKNFPRSKGGLAQAGEWETLKKLFPEFTNKNVLDVGCGFGWHCLYAASHGAKKVLGIDISKKMLAVAEEKNTFSNVNYQLCPMEEINFSQNSFDIVLSSLAFHYTEDFKGVCEKIRGCMTKGGTFIFSVEHPIFTAEGTQDWIYDDEGQPLYFPVDHYFTEGKRETFFLGEKVVKYHRTLTSYLGILQETGFSIEKVVEPMPSDNLLIVPGMKDELRRPMMLIIKAVAK